MPIDDETHAWRRRLPHFQRIDRNYFLTFVTRDRIVLSASDRDAVLATLLNAHGRSLHLYAAVVMPDHVHFIAMVDPSTTIPAVMKYIKSVSSKAMGRRIWQREFFDYMIRHDENLWKKTEYVLNNPVREMLVDSIEEYRWKWRLWVEGERHNRN